MKKRKSKTTELADEAAMLDGPTPAAGDEPPSWEDRAPVPEEPTPETTIAALEERVRRLEDAFALIQSALPADTAFTSRPPSRPRPENLTVPAAPELNTDVSAPLAAPPQAVPLPPSPPTPLRRPLLLFDALAEARLILRMIVDPRYRMSWSGRLVPLVLFAAFLLSWWWIPGTSLPLFGTLLNKTVDLVLIFFLFKVLGREAQRYRETSPDVPATLRR